MATITITIPTAQDNRVLDAFSAEYGWTPASGQTKAAFAKNILMEIIRKAVQAQEGKQAAITAQQAAATQITLT